MNDQHSSRMTVLIIVSVVIGVAAMLFAAQGASRIAAENQQGSFEALDRAIDSIGTEEQGKVPLFEEQEVLLPYQYPWLTGLVVGAIAFILGRVFLIGLTLESAARRTAEDRQ